MNNKTIISLIAVLFLASAPLISCDNNATGQDESEDVDFVQNVVSGSVVATTQNGDVIIQLELSPVTTYFEENPGFEAGIVNTDNFFVLFEEIFGGLSPNSVLVLRDNGTALSVPILLSSPDYDPMTGIVEYTATPLEFTSLTTFTGDSIVSRSIEDLESPFGPAFLFIDSGGFNPNGGECGDGANLVCPIGLNSSPCLNQNAEPECCTLGNGVSCGDCFCNQ